MGGTDISAGTIQAASSTALGNADLLVEERAPHFDARSVEPSSRSPDKDPADKAIGVSCASRHPRPRGPGTMTHSDT